MDFSRYKDLVNKYYQKDCRELNFQNRIVIPFIESLIPEQYDVVDSSTLYKNWKKINRVAFAGQYTPDVLVVDNWNLFDENKQGPKIIIEVKSPTADDREHANKEVEEYLEKSNCVILTDCITWEFHENNGENKCFHLDNEILDVCKRDVPKDRVIHWKDDIIPDDWDSLCNKIKGIFKINNSDL